MFNIDINLYNKKSGIYIIENVINNKKYIGSAVDLYKRFNEHKNKLNNGTHENKHLQNSWNIYNEEFFIIYPIEYIDDKSKLISREQFWLDSFKSDEKYNIRSKADSREGIKHTEESKIKMSLAKKGKFIPWIKGKTHSNETRIKLKNFRTGKKHTIETRIKMREQKVGRKGIKHTEESKIKIGLSSLGRKHTDETKQLIREKNSGEKNGMYGRKLSKDIIEKRNKTREENLKNKGINI